MLYKNVCGFNLNLIRTTLFIGTYDIFGTLTLIILNYEFFAPSELREKKLSQKFVCDFCDAFFSANATADLYLVLLGGHNGSDFVDSRCI